MMWRCMTSVTLIAAGISVMLNSGEAAVEKDILRCMIVKNERCPDQKYIKLNLYTRSNPNTSQIITLEPDNLSTTSFKAGNPTKIIVHGFNTNYTTKPFYIDFMNKYLLQDDINLIIVDWFRLCNGIQCYFEAIHNTHHVAECVAGLIQQLRSVGITDIQLIGHSLGGQIAGLTANYLKPYKLPRITGLDPASLLYYTVSNDEKLDAGDAIFVEALHTNVYEFGIDVPSGHVDYYFNGGTYQPGCGSPITNLYCSHERAIWYYAESLTSAEGFWGWHCLSFPQYYLGFCKTKPRTVLMGNTTNRGIVSVPTASSSPYAVGKYHQVKKLS